MKTPCKQHISFAQSMPALLSEVLLLCITLPLLYLTSVDIMHTVVHMYIKDSSKQCLLRDVAFALVLSVCVCSLQRTWIRTIVAVTEKYDAQTAKKTTVIYYANSTQNEESDPETTKDTETTPTEEQTLNENAPNKPEAHAPRSPLDPKESIGPNEE